MNQKFVKLLIEDKNKIFSIIEELGIKIKRYNSFYVFGTNNQNIYNVFMDAFKVEGYKDRITKDGDGKWLHLEKDNKITLLLKSSKNFLNNFPNAAELGEFKYFVEMHVK